MKISEIFKKEIARPVRGVVTVGEIGNESEIRQELEEYVFTREILNHLKEFYSRYAESIDGETREIGVWVSGFFGSGKSHFERINAILLSNPTIDGKSVSEYLIQDNRITDEALISDIRKAVSVPTDVILFNIDSRSELSGKRDRETITLTLLRVFNEMQGFCSIPLVADIERNLCKKGLYEAFKANFEKISGSPWVTVREDFDYLQDDVVNALVSIGAMSEESARNTCRKIAINYGMDTESFARLVKNYLDTKGENQHIIFMVDEMGQYIGENHDLMLNLQTVTEDLGRICKGKAWLFVTSQQEFDVFTKMHSDDFSKIQGRFATRLNLTSANADEVITERILRKNQKGKEKLCRLFADKETMLKNLFLWNPVIRENFYRDDEHFSAVYPFVPYQFQAVNEILKSFRMNGISGKHLADGERSMLAIFQECAVYLKTMEIGALVPLWMFYNAFEKMIESKDKFIISDAKENQFHMNLLKTLFLLKYANGISPTVENITSLMISHADENRMQLQTKVKNALESLVRQSLIACNGSQYQFLTIEEQQENSEISAIPIAFDERWKMIAKLIFDEIYPEKNFRLPKSGKRYQFHFNRMLDGKLYQSHQNAPMTVHILTPDSPEPITDSNAMELLSGQSDAVLIVLPPDRGFIDELVRAKQLETYFSGDISGNSEFRDRRRNAKIYLENSLKSATIYIKGEKIRTTSKDVRLKINEGIQKLVNLLYHKISYITMSASAKDIFSVLDAEIIQNNANQYALDEMKIFLTRNPAKISLKALIEKFRSAPYGFTETDIEWLVAVLFKTGEIDIYYNNEIISLTNCSSPKISDYLTKKEFAEMLFIHLKIAITLPQIKAVRNVMNELFHVLCQSENPEIMMNDFRKNAEILQNTLEKIKLHYTAQPKYPSQKMILDGIQILNEIMMISIPYEFFEAVRKNENMLLDFAEDFEPVQKFFSGEQKKIFDDALQILENYEISQNYITDKEIKSIVMEIETIIFSQIPYEKLYQIPILCEKFRSLNNCILQKTAESVKMQLILTKKFIFSELQEWECSLQNEFSKRFEKLENKIATCENIAIMQGFHFEIDALKVNCLNEIAEIRKESVNQKFISIQSVNVSPVWQIRTESDIKKYIAELEKSLLSALEEDTIINIEF